MRRTVDIDGALVRKERESRHWTQEKLSEVCRLGVRTVRRLESGQASLESLRRVAEALNLEPTDILLESSTGPQAWSQLESLFDLLVVEFAPNICNEDFIKNFVERVGSVRRHLYRELGYLMPGVRFRDHLKVETGTYRILVREKIVEQAQLKLDSLLAVGGELDSLVGTPCHDPTYRMPALWIAPENKETALKAGASVFTPVDVISTHLTSIVRERAYQLLGIEETAALLDDLNRPRTVQEVIPHKLTLTELRALLRELLKEQISIRDLGLILELLADGEGEETSEERLERVRGRLQG